jgi:hypothetical protein
VQVVWIGGTEVRDVPAADVLAEYGVPVEVPDDVAGRPPIWRRVEGGEQVMPWQQTRPAGKAVEVLDLGAGLLAQVDCWATPDTEQGQAAVAAASVPAPAGGTEV